MPYTILESLAAGTPIVTTRQGGIADVIIDDKQGVFVQKQDHLDLAKKLLFLHQNQSLLVSMSQECIKRARENYGVNRLANDFRGVYKSLTA